jgi:hypothetical protein
MATMITWSAGRYRASHRAAPGISRAGVGRQLGQLRAMPMAKGHRTDEGSSTCARRLLRNCATAIKTSWAASVHV